jgi:hypothetical protein
MALNTGNADTQLGSAAAPVLTAGTGQSISILKATATNTDTAARTITLYRVPQGGTAGTANIIAADATPLSAGETITLPLSGHTLIAGQSLQGFADVGAKVMLNLSYASTP